MRIKVTRVDQEPSGARVITGTLEGNDLVEIQVTTTDQNTGEEAYAYVIGDYEEAVVVAFDEGVDRLVYVRRLEPTLAQERIAAALENLGKKGSVISEIAAAIGRQP